ncbi:hypothetical protein CBFG_02884 [Clostridiales bacterium 1_7_47FAA]|nr:hypothetical protein CBFG_02884 [Clostridiales bacterium 1_7_47FAA]
MSSFPFIGHRRSYTKPDRHLFLCHTFTFPVFTDYLAY